MKNIFDKEVKNEVLIRIDNLTVDAQRNWGTLTVTQMIAHLARAIKIPKGETKIRRLMIGRILAPFIKSRYYNDKPYPKNVKMGMDPTIPDEKLFESEKKKLVNIVTEFSDNYSSKCTSNPHPFFGYLTSEQWGKAVYKHLDHHLRQFGQ